MPINDTVVCILPGIEKNILVKIIDEKKVWNFRSKSYQIKFTLHISIDGEGGEIIFLDKACSYLSGDTDMTCEKAYRAIYDFLVSASEYEMYSFDDFCIKKEYWDVKDCKRIYDLGKKYNELAKRILSMNSNEMMDLAKKIAKENDYFSSRDVKIVDKSGSWGNAEF